MKVVASSPSANCVVSLVSTGVEGMEKVRAAAALTGLATHTVGFGASGTGRAAMI